MQELSLYILDITMNGVAAGADTIQISIEENGNAMTITIADNGCGMNEETVQKLTDPFYTTRTTRKVGMGVPLFQMMAEMTGGSLTVTSTESPREGHGTTFEALVYTDSIDCVPLGDMVTTITTLIQGSPDVDFVYNHTVNGENAELDTRELREVLGDVPLSEPDILQWIRENLEEQYSGIYGRS